MIHAREDYNRIQDPAGKIGTEEPVFLLRAQDMTAPAIVRAWATEQKKYVHADQKAIALAEAHADRMEQWQRDHGCKLANV